MRTVIIVISIPLLFSCGQEECRETYQIVQQQINIPVSRFEEDLFEMENVEEVEKFLSDHMTFTDVFLDGLQYPSDSILAKRLFRLIQDPSIDTLYTEAKAEFEDFSDVKADLEGLFGRLQTLYPGVETPRMETVVTGFYNDLFISDTLIVIGIDYFIGRNATYHPVDIPNYILARYDKAHLPGIIAKFMAGYFVQTGKTETMVSEMVDFGKTYFLASRLLPCTPDSLLLGYTQKNIKVINENQAIIWANFIENEILFETNRLIKQKFLGERPNIYEISKECPGRIGAWIGWQIVESYMEKNPDVTIQQLLSETDNEKIFRDSGYKPKGMTRL